MELYFILAGIFVGFCVGVTGVGGGSLMTPILILLLKVEPHIAVGTDLLYAAISKFFGGVVHFKKSNVVWPIVLWLAIGSIPASIVTNYLVATYLGNINAIKLIMTLILGVMLTITGISLIFRNRIEAFFDKYRKNDQTDSLTSQIPKYKLVLMGILLGVVVTLSSVGAGAFGVMALVLNFSPIAAHSYHRLGCGTCGAINLSRRTRTFAVRQCGFSHADLFAHWRDSCHYCRDIIEQ